MIRIDICIISFKRPEGLTRLLASISRLERTSDIVLRIIVVDNDLFGSARAVVESAKQDIFFPIIYDVEPVQNIALARNRCLKHSAADYIALIDDDEVPSPRWLSALLACACQYKADVVFGPVLTSLPGNAPAWAREGAFFERPRFVTGTMCDTGGSGNVLVKGELLKEDFRFAAEFGQTGGSDTVFFRQLFLAGKKLVWCDEAEVVEYVESNRLSIRWLLRRAFRSGQGVYRIFHAGKRPGKKVLWLADTVRNIIVALLLLLVSPFAGRVAVISSLRRMASLLGAFSAPLGMLFREYK